MIQGKIKKINKKSRIFVFISLALVFFIFSLILFNFGKTNLINNFLKEEVVFNTVFGQKDFKLTEDLKFEFSYEHKKRNTFLTELISRFNGEKDINIKSEIISLRGEKIENYNFEIEYLEQEKFSFKLFPIENDFKPGKYSLKVIAEKDGQILGTQEKEFTWGVLAINFNKSIYTLEDKQAYVQMAVLNDKGNTLCDADLEMTIISPEGNIEHFSTDSGNIKYSGECRGDSYVEVPDYFAYYQLPYWQAEIGEYIVELTAYTYNGTRTIVDFFQVRETVLFDIERIGPTRIYPPADYEIRTIVKANQDFEGKIVETVPGSFSIFENEITNSKFQIRDSNQKEKQIVWQVELKKGETYQFSYQFNAPNISPYLFLLGPLKIGGFEEARQWQIASDASANLTLRPDANGAENTWAVTGTTSNYQAVNSATPSETVYVGKTSTAYGNDLYALPNPDRTAKGTINSVTVYINHRRITTNRAGENAPILRTNSTVYIGTGYTRDTYTLDSHAWSQNPNNSSAWTWNDIDALQIGIRYVAGHNLQTGVRCNQSYVVVNYEIIELPGPPGTPTYTSISTSTLTVNWTAPLTGGLADYYELERALDVGGSPGAFSQIATTTATTSSDSGLSSGTFYWYQVRAVNLAGAGNYSASSSVLTLSGPPGTPTYSNISTSTLRVSWTVPSGETPDYYEVERAPNDGGSPGAFSEIGTTSNLYYDDSGLEKDTTYWYQVRAVNQSGAGTYSNYSNVTTLDAPPGIPTMPTYDNVSTSTLKIEWTMGEGGQPAYYKIERALDVGGSPGVFSQIATTTEIFYNDSGLTQSTAYWYQIRAWNALGDSDYSASSSVKTFPDIPGTPTYSNIATTTLQVNWTASAGGTPDYYKIERAPDVSGSPGSFSQIATTTNIFYNDSGLDSLVKYWYRIRATNITGDSEYSGYSDVTTLDAPPGTPGTPTYSNVTGSTLRVNWTAPIEGGEVYYYELERADDNSGSPGVFSQIATTTNLYFNDSGLQGVTIYWYQVQAINDLGESGFSTASFVSTASATILKGNIRIKGGTIIR